MLFYGFLDRFIQRFGVTNYVHVGIQRFFTFVMLYLAYMSLSMLSDTSTSKFIPIGIYGLHEKVRHFALVNFFAASL